MKIPGGTTAYIGPPAKPIPKQVSGAIGKALSEIPEIVEAHLPMVYIKGHVDPPAQVLVVVVEENKPSPHAKITEVLRAVSLQKRSRTPLTNQTRECPVEHPQQDFPKGGVSSQTLRHQRARSRTPATIEYRALAKQSSRSGGASGLYDRQEPIPTVNQSKTSPVKNRISPAPIPKSVGGAWLIL